MNKEMNESGLSRHLPLVILLLFVTLVWFGPAWLKDVWFCDEVYSYESANSGIFYYLNPLDDSAVWLDGREIREYLSTGAKAFNFIEIEKYLYPDHVPLYFIALRVASLLVYGQITKWIGLGLNLVLFLLSTWLLFLIAERALRNRIAAAFATAAVMVCPMMISQATVIRMYMMMFFFALAVLNIAREEFLFDEDFSSGKVFLRCLFLAVFTAGGLLTHYYFWIFIAAFSLCFIVLMIIRGRGDTIRPYILTMIASIGLATLGFPLLWKRTLLSPDGSTKTTDTLANLTDLSRLGERIKTVSNTIMRALAPDLYRDSVSHYIYLGILAFVIVAAFAVMIFRNHFRLKEFKSEKGLGLKFKEKAPASAELAVILITALIDLAVIAWLSGALSIRYMWLPLLLMIAVISISVTDVVWKVLKKLRPVSIAVSVLLVASAIAGIVNVDNIEWLRYRTPSEMTSVKSATNGATVLVFSDEVDYVMHCSYFDFKDAGRIIRIARTDELAGDETLKNSNEVVVYTLDDLRSAGSCAKFVEAASGRTVTDKEMLGHSGYMSVYRFTVGE